MTITTKPYPNALFLSLSFILIVAGIGAAIIYPKVGLERYDTRGARAKAIYWFGMCSLGVVLYGLAFINKKLADKGPGKVRIIIGGLVAVLGLLFSIFSFPFVMKSFED